MRICSDSVVTPPKLLANSGECSTAILNPSKFNKKPMITKKIAKPNAARMIVAEVMDIVLMRPVGPDNHMSCMNHFFNKGRSF